MATGKELVYPIVFDPSRARKGARDAERELDRLNRSGSRAMGGLKTAGIAAGAGFAALAIGAAKFGTDAVKAAMESEKALARTQKLLDNAGISWAKYGAQIEKAIDAQSQLSGMDDEELLQSFGQFARVTKDVNSALDLNQKAMDIARGRGISLAAAQKILLQVWNGNEGALKRLGIATDNIKTRQQALAAVQQQFGGSAKAYGETAAGAADRIGVAWENFKETIGKRVLPVVARVFNVIAQVLNQQGPIWDKVRAAGQRVVDWYQENLAPTIRSVVSVVRALWNKFGDTLMNVVKEAVGFIGRTLGRVKDFIQGVIEIIQGIVNGDWGKVWEGLKRAAGAAIGELIDALKTIPATLLNAAKDIGIKIAVALKDGFKSIISDIWGLIFSGGNAPSSGEILAAIRASGRQARNGRARGGYIGGSGPSGVDSVPILAAPGEVILNEHQQRMLGPRRIMDVVRATGGVVGGRRFAAGGFVSGIATVYGGTAGDDNGFGAGPFGGQRLSQWNDTFAEMNYGRAMGGLPYGSKIDVKVGGRTATLVKRDIGGNPGNGAVLDIHANSARVLGISPTDFKGTVLWRPHGAAADGVPGGGQRTSAGEAFALAQLGKPYVYGGGRGSGGLNQSNWDCSSFAIAAAKSAGANVTLGGSTASAWQESTPLSSAQAATAPVVWGFYSSSGGPVDGGPDEHMGIRISGVWFDASSSFGGVRKGALSDDFWNKGIRLPRGLSATDTSSRTTAGSPTTAPAATGPSASAIAAAQASDPRATSGVPANANTSLVTSSSLNAGGAPAPTSNFRFDTRDEPSAGGIARPGSGAPANRVPAGWTEIPHRIYVGKTKPNMATLRSRVPADWRIEITQAGDGRWVATAFEPVPPPAQAPDGGGGGDGGGDASAPASPPSLADLLAPQQAEVRKRLALASLTADPTDDIAAANFAVEIAGHLLNLAMASGDPNLIADAANNLKSAQDFLAALQQNTDALNANTEALNNFAGAIGFSFRGQGYYVGQGRTQSSDSLLDMGVGV